MGFVNEQRVLQLEKCCKMCVPLGKGVPVAASVVLEKRPKKRYVLSLNITLLVLNSKNKLTNIDLHK